MNSKDLKVRLSYRLPIDPLEIRSMADYDMALLLSDTWFNYDDSRKAKSNLISEWVFDQAKGIYKFKINQEKKWSNGTPLKAEDLIWNLKRSIKLESQYGKSISALIDISSISITNESTILIKTTNKKPSESFFQRMGGQPLAIVHPSDVDKSTLKVISNKVSIGPYYMSKVNSGGITLEKNKYFQSENKKSPSSIYINQAEAQFNLNDFINEKTWENIIQVNTFLLPETEKILKEKKLPHWTRGHDRVSLLKPINKDNLPSLKALLIRLSLKLEEMSFNNLPLNVIRATSLQPLGYPLHDKLTSTKKSSVTLPKAIRILSPSGQSSESHMKILKPIFDSMGVDTTWDFYAKSEFSRLLYSNKQYDLALFDFGVADPEPSTWIGVITTNEFIHLDSGDIEKFQKVSKINNIEDEVKEFKIHLKESFEKGNYLPLFHFSTLSIGHHNIEFTLIRDLDETVNYSKIIIK